MTNEEKAENYYFSLRDKKLEFTYGNVIKCIKQAYLDGLAEGELKWHDLRKDPKDLPDRMGINSKEVYVAYSDNNCTDFASYNFKKGIWERSENNSVATIVVAWCEIPKFEEK